MYPPSHKYKRGDEVTPSYQYDFSLTFRHNKSNFIQSSHRLITNLKHRKVSHSIEFDKNNNIFSILIKKDEQSKKQITTVIPLNIRAVMKKDKFMQECIYLSPGSPNRLCSGQLEWEHAFVYKGKKIQARWAIVPCCTNHNRGQAMVKDYNRYRALKRVIEEVGGYTIDNLSADYQDRDWWMLWHQLETTYEK